MSFCLSNVSVSLPGRITNAESLFWYEGDDNSDTFQDPEFEPITEIEWASEAEEQEADELCQGDQACYYDYFVTKDAEFATHTRVVNQKNTDTEADLRKLDELT